MELIIDLETLGTKPGDKIIQIGMVAGEFITGYMEFQVHDTFCIDISRHAVGQEFFKESPATLSWWASQSDTARELLDRPPEQTDDVKTALQKTIHWIGDQRARNERMKMNIWGNAPSFDCAFLKEAFDVFNLGHPWQFWEEKCIRTVYEMCKTVTGIDPKRILPRTGTHHNAADDALYEAQYLTRSIYCLKNAG